MAIVVLYSILLIISRKYARAYFELVQLLYLSELFCSSPSGLLALAKTKMKQN